MTPPDFPGLDEPYDAMPRDPSARHEAFVALFGRYLMWLRRSNQEATRRLTEDPVARLKLGKIQGRPFERAAEMADDDREAAIRLAEASADRFMRSFLHLLIHVGTDLPLGPDHHVRLRLEIEVARDGDGEVVEREVLNRGGARCFDEYWGRWINRPGAEAGVASD